MSLKQVTSNFTQKKLLFGGVLSSGLLAICLIIFSVTLLPHSQDVRTQATVASLETERTPEVLAAEVVAAIPGEEGFPNGTLGELPVYIIRYLPEDPSKSGYLDPNETATSMKISDMQAQLERFDRIAIDDLTKGSIFRGYKPENANNPPAIKYKIHGYSPVYKEKMKRGLLLKTNNDGLKIYRPDYRQILNRENVCDLVDNKGVKQIWIWGYHHGDIEPTESNLSMGTISKDFFNYRDRNFGDISNSERTDDLPQCQTTYAVFVYNMTRGVGEMLEDHSHHAEAIFNALDRKGYLPGDLVPQTLFWGKFVGSDVTGLIKRPGCGWTHRTPNETTSEEYNWFKTSYVDSDCMDWLPDGGGKKTPINCTTWTKTDSCPYDGGEAFKVWWYQSFPGINNGLSYDGRPLRNWWEPIYDFDKALRIGGGLYQPLQNVRYTVHDEVINNMIYTKIFRNPPLKPYDVIELKVQRKSGTTHYYNMVPRCDNTGCYMFLAFPNTSSSQDYVTEWSILTDYLVPHKGTAAKVTNNTANWTHSNINDYHSGFVRKVATPPPTPPPTETPDPTPKPVVTPPPTQCPYNPDVTGDGKVDIFDFNAVISNYGKSGAGLKGDINCSKEVDIFDFNYVIGRYGK